MTHQTNAGGDPEPRPTTTAVGGEGQWLGLAAILLLATALRAAAFDPFAIIHVDEMMQYLERANRLVTGYGIVTWEQRFGMRNWIIPQLLALPIWIVHQFAPGTVFPAIAAKLSVAAISLTAILSAHAIGRRTSPFHALIAAFALAVWYQSIYYSDSLLSENMATIAILAGIALAMEQGCARRRLLAAGFLLGLGLLFRFPYAVFVGVATIGLNRFDYRRWAWMAAGGILALALGAGSDMLAGMTPFAWLVNNFHQNIADGQAQRFGIEGPLFYPERLFFQFGPAIGAIAALSLACPPRYRFLLAAAMADMLAHSLLAHKELRFIYLSTTTMVLLAALATGDLALRLRVLRPRQAWLLPFVLWGGLSAWAWQAGHHRAPMRIANPAAPLALNGLRSHSICGLILSDSFRYSVPLAFLGRAVPLYSEHRKLGPGVHRDADPIPPVVLRAANAIIAPARDAIPTPYHARRCLPQQDGRPACLFVRPGGCQGEAAKAYLLQKVLIASGL